ncbi:MAG: gliding motility-associated C-terminal domain-containing protein [Bacteroidetes bacterium]|nr:gliding motility-associated C-terminal domain-containing protein [Bacteroidota bacterium]
MKSLYLFHDKLFIAIIITLNLNFSTLYLSAQGTWTQKASMGGASREGSVGFSIGTKGYVCMGLQFGFYRDLWEWNQATNTWSQMANMPGIERAEGIGFSIGAKGYAGMGWNTSGAGGADTMYNDLYEWDQGSNTWSQKANFPGSYGRAGASAFSIGTIAYVGLGSDTITIYNDWWEWNQGANNWTQNGNFPGGARWFAVPFVLNGRGYLATGNSGISIKKDLWEYNPGTDSWIQKANFPGTARWQASAFAICSRGYVGTGSTNLFLSNNTKDFYQWDPATDSWTQVADLGGAVRRESAFWAIGDTGYVACGNGGGLTFFNDLWQFTCDTCYLILSATSTDATDSLACDGQATVNVSGGTAPFTYLWNDPAPAQTASTATGLCYGTYTVTVTDSKGCMDSISVTADVAAGCFTVSYATTNVTCFNGTDGAITATVNGGSPPYTYAWSTGQTTSAATGLSAGSVTVTITDNAASSPFWTETFQNGCSSGCAGSSYVGPNGAWTQTNTGANGAGANQWFASGAECGNAAGTCGSACGTTDPSMHVGTNPNSECYCFFCADPAGDCGAAYDASSAGACFGFCAGGGVTTNKRIESPTINCSGYSSITLTFNYIENGQGTSDNATVWYYDGATWAPIDDPPKSSVNGCGGGQHRWLSRTVNLPASANNNANVKIGFLWENNADNTGTDPSFAVDDIELSAAASSCSVSDILTVTQPLQLTVSIASTDATCNSSNGQATASSSGGTGGCSYSWNTVPVQNTASATGLSAGTYTVTATDGNGCTATSSVTINTTGVPSITITAINESCIGNNGSATSSVTGGNNPYTYNWSTSATTSAITGLTAGNYTLTVTDNIGCTDVESTTISNTGSPSVTLNITDVSCSGGATGSATTSVSGGVSPYSFNWSGGQSTSGITGISAGNYTVTVTDASGCTDAETTAITEPTALAISLTKSDENCGSGDGTITAVVSGGVISYSFLWSNSATTSALTGLSAGNYTVTVTDGNGCTVSADTIINNLGGLTASLSSTDNLCGGGSMGNATVTASGGSSPYTYNWSNSETNSVTTGLLAGTYYVSVYDASSCLTVDSAVITEPPSISLSLSSTDETCSSSNGTATANASGGTGTLSYSWSNSATSSTVTGLSSGIFSVTVTDDNSCSQNNSVVINNNPGPIPSVAASSVSCNGFSDGTASVTGSGGTLPYTYLWSTGGTLTSITGLNAGTFYVTLSDNNGCSSLDSALIAQPAVLTVTVSKTDAGCGLNDGNADATSGGGVVPYSYQWSNGSTNSATGAVGSGSYTVTVTDANGCTITSTVLINSSGGPSSSVTSTGNGCFGDSTGTATVSASGGTPPYSYSWSDGQTDSAATGLPAGTFFITITDAGSCATVDSVSVTEPPVISLNIFVTDELCGNSDGTAGVTATGGTGSYSYLWTTLETTSSTSGLAAGNYTVTVSDANNCTKTALASINNIPGPSVSVLSTDALCSGSGDGTATLTGSGGTPPYTILWSDSQTTVTITGLAPGSYYVTVTDNSGCSDTDSALISEPGALNVTLTATDASCGINDGNAVAAVSGGVLPYTYTWSNGDSAQSADSLFVGIISVTVTDGNTCTETGSAAVNNIGAPSVNITSSDVMCNGDSSASAFASPSGGSPPYTFNWSDGQADSSATGLIAGNYTLTVTDAGGCATLSSTSVTEPPAISLSFTTVNSSCGGSDGSATVTASGGVLGYSFLWYDGQTTFTATGLTAGNYDITVIDGNGCTQTGSTAVLSSGIPAINITVTDVNCNGGSSAFASASASGGSPPYTYNWSNGQTDSTATGLFAGTCSVTVTDAFGCTVIDSAAITEPPPLSISFAVNDAACGNSDGSVSAIVTGGSGSYTYLWSTSNTTSAINNLFAGNYTVTVSDGNGCSDSNVAPVNNIGGTSIMLDSLTNVTCNGSSDGAIGITVSGVSLPYTYLWSNSAVTEDITALSTGSFTVSVTDSAGCISISSFSITEPVALVLSTGKTDASCGGSDGSAWVTASGGTPAYSYLWSNGDTNAVAVAVGSGSYTITVTDGNGCTGNSSVTVNEAGAGTVTIDSVINVSCFGGNDGAVTVAVAGGSPPYSYLWSNGDTDSVAAAVAGGSYTVTVTDINGCAATASAVVTEPAILWAILSTTDVLCFGECTGSGTVVVLGGTPPYTYNWYNGAPGTTIPACAGPISVTITDANGCSLSLADTVYQLASPLVALFASTEPTCFGLCNGEASVTASGGTTPYTYLWFNGSNLDSVTVCAGNAAVTVTDGNGCIYDSSVSISQPPALSFTINSTNVSCYGLCDGSVSAISIGGSPPYTYQWSAGNGTNLCPGDYSLTVTDQNSCTISDTVAITQPPPVIAAITGDSATCAGEPVTLIASGGINYLWNTGETVSTITVSPDSTAIYSVTVLTGPCSDSAVFIITVYPLVAVNAGNDTSIYIGDNANLTATVTGGTSSYTYTWSPGNLTGQSINVSPAVTTEYLVEVIDANGCRSDDKVVVTILPCDAEVFIPNVFAPGCKCPDNKFYVFSDCIETFEISIFDRWGEKVFETNDQKAGWDGMFNGKMMDAAVYVYHLKYTTINAPNDAIKVEGNVNLVR